MGDEQADPTKVGRINPSIDPIKLNRDAVQISQTGVPSILMIYNYQKNKEFYQKFLQTPFAKFVKHKRRFDNGSSFHPKVDPFGGKSVELKDGCLTISHRHILNIEVLDVVCSNNLSELPLINGVSIFKYAKSVNILDCAGLIDLTVLSNVERLAIEDCSGQIDLSVLKDKEIKELSLSGCESVTDVSSLKNIPELNLSYCQGVSDISMLSGVKNLRICYCQNITSLVGLDSLERIDIRGCPHSFDLSVLKKSVLVVDSF